MSKAMRQMPERSGRAGAARGEAERDPASDEARGPPREHPATGSARPKAGAGTLLEAALTRENLTGRGSGSRPTKAQPVSMVWISIRLPNICVRRGPSFGNNCCGGRTGPVRYVG